MARLNKFYRYVDAYFDDRSRKLYYGGKWRKSYSPSSGNEKIKRKLLRSLYRDCSGNEIKLFLAIVDSMPETYNPYESQVVRIVSEDWKHILTGTYFSSAVNLFLELGYFDKAPYRSMYILDPHLWCKTKESVIEEE